MFSDKLSPTVVYEIHDRVMVKHMGSIGKLLEFQISCVTLAKLLNLSRAYFPKPPVTIVSTLINLS